MSQTPIDPDSGQGDPVDPVQEGAPATGPEAPQVPTHTQDEPSE